MIYKMKLFIKKGRYALEANKLSYIYYYAIRLWIRIRKWKKQGKGSTLCKEIFRPDLR
jgi:hypothetical protein